MIYLVLFLVVFWLASMRYVYASRGDTRFLRMQEYLRKGWPIFAPLNCLLYLFTKKEARHPIMELGKFSDLQPLKDNWTTIRDEALALQKSGFYEDINKPGSAAHYDVGFQTFYKFGWRKFYLKWYGGYVHNSAKKHCPKTLEILSRVKSVNGAMFAILPPHSQLTRHLDPVACSLRYHLGLMTPNSDDCFISVDGQIHSWRDGEGLVFDETFIHFVRNDTDSERLILMCDVERPMNIFGQFINLIYKGLMSLSVVPNTSEDKSGLFNRIFRSVAPIVAKGKVMKLAKPRLYKLLKHLINAVLIILLFFILIGVVKFFLYMFSI